MNLHLHHIGIVVREIAAASDLYCSRFNYVAQTGVIHDPRQQAYVQFLRLAGDGVFVELVAPDTDGSPLLAAAQKGHPLHHLCYSVEDLENACKELRERGLTLIGPPVEAVAFGGRKIAWLMGRDRIPVELLEAGARFESSSSESQPQV